MVNWQAELIDSLELSPDTPASDRSACPPPLCVIRCSSPGRPQLPGHGRGNRNICEQKGRPRLYSAEIPDQRSVSAACASHVTLALGRPRGLPRNIRSARPAPDLAMSRPSGKWLIVCGSGLWLTAQHWQATTRVANTKTTVVYTTVPPPIPLDARSHPGTAVRDGTDAVRVASGCEPGLIRIDGGHRRRQP